MNKRIYWLIRDYYAAPCRTWELLLAWQDKKRAAGRAA